MKNSTKKFNELHQVKTSRKDLENLLHQAKRENNTEIIYRISKILNDYPTVNNFKINVISHKGLGAARHSGSYKEALDDCGRLKKGWKFENGIIFKVQKKPKKGLGNYQSNLTIEELEHLGVPYIENPVDLGIENDDVKGLGKPVSSNDIYNMITEKLITQIKKATGKGYIKKWKADNSVGFFKPINYESKKIYRGINFLLLSLSKKDFFGAFENPYFLTFKQIEKYKGQLKKGSKAKPIIYFTKLYKIEKEEHNFASYDLKKLEKYCEKNEIDKKLISYIPILKYYNVFNGADIEGIDFKLYDLKNDLNIGENKIAKLIVKNYKTSPKIVHGGDRAFYMPSRDFVQMPPLKSFETEQDYYSTLFHELTHSAGHKKRLDRDMGGKFGSKSYAKEELVAEFGAVFLSAYAGFMWKTDKNHSEYLKNWSKVIDIAEKDNKFLMRGASDAQRAADYILGIKNGSEPTFYKDLKSQEKSKKDKKTTRSTKSKKVKYTPKNNLKVDKNGQMALFGALGLPKQLELYTDELRNMRVTELRKFTLQYYRQYLAGKTAEIKSHLKEVHFVNRAGRKIAYGGSMYKEKAVIIEHLEQLIKNSTYNNWGDRKEKDSEEILGYLNFKSKLIIDGVKRHLRIAISVDKYGKKKLKNYDVGKRKTIVPQKGVSPSDGEVQSSFKNKITKTKPKTQKNAKKGLGTPLMSLIQKDSERPREYYDIPNENVKTFLGNIEKKNKESVVITVTGGQGSGKTRFTFQLIDAFGQNYNVGHASIEEHPESSLYINKVHEYLSEKAITNVSVPEIKSLSDLDKLIKDNDVIVIDSFAKMKEIDKSFEVDKDLRKKYDGKLFIVIFQQTSNGTMRGGTKSQFDADIVLFTEKFDDFSKNYIYIDKNRYQDKNLGDLKYSIYYQKLI